MENNIVNSRFTFRFFLMSLATLLVGCGSSDRGFVTGKVVHADGSPLVGARVIANCEETSKTAYSTTGLDGSYAIATADEQGGLPPGEYTVYLIEDRGLVEGQMKRTIARKYTDPRSSGLSFQIEAGENKTFDITTDPP